MYQCRCLVLLIPNFTFSSFLKPYHKSENFQKIPIYSIPYNISSEILFLLNSKILVFLLMVGFTISHHVAYMYFKNKFRELIYKVTIILQTKVIVMNSFIILRPFCPFSHHRISCFHSFWDISKINSGVDVAKPLFPRKTYKLLLSCRRTATYLLHFHSFRLSILDHFPHTLFPAYFNSSSIFI